MKLVTSLKAVVLIFMLCSANVFAFSDEYEPYYPQITAVMRSVEEIYERTTHPDTVLSEEVIKARKDIIQMYKDFGLDLSFRFEEGGGETLVANVPQRWSPKTPKPIDPADASLAFSVDAAWQNKIPEDAPRVQIPVDAYGKNIQITMVKSNRQNTDADGIGIPMIAGGAKDPYQTIIIKDYRDTEQYYGYFRMRLPEGIVNYVNNTQISDEHALFMDTESKTGLEVWLVCAKGDPRGYGTAERGYLPSADIRGCSAGFIYKLGGIAAEGRSGCNAAGLPMSAFTIKPSEIQNDEKIEHALGICMNRMWAARTFPAYCMDGHMRTEDNKPANSIYAGSCVPYGGIVQLDPEIDLEKLVADGKLSKPGYKVLKAWQEYGAYNIDCCGFETTSVYTSTNGTDWTNPDDPGFNVPFRNGEQSGAAVSQEVKAFMNGDEFFGVGMPKLYVTTPVVKMAELDVNGDGAIDWSDYDAVVDAQGKELNDSIKIYDVNQDKEIGADDIEVMYRYLKDLPMHDMVFYSAVEKDNDTEHGRILAGGGMMQTVNGVNQYRKDSIVQFTAFPNDGYEFDCWTGDFAGQKEATVQVTMDREYVFGAKYRKIKEEHALTVKTVGGGHVEVHTDKNLEYGKPQERYTKNTLLAFKAVPDEGWVFAGWQGAYEGFTNPCYRLVEDSDIEITALFVKDVYNDTFKPNNWLNVDGKQEEKTFHVTEDWGIESDYESFPLSEVLALNYNPEIDLSGDYLYRVLVSSSSRINNGIELVFNYKDKNNYYYFKIGGLGLGATLGKCYNGYKTTLAKYNGKPEVNGVLVDGTPMHIEVVRKNGEFSAYGYKNGAKLAYFENIKDKTHNGGKVGVAALNYGLLQFREVKIQKEVPDVSQAVIQK